MPEPIKVDPALLPTLQELGRATVGAVIVAAILLVTAVLPAEAGIDPTGVGRLLGLTTLGQIKQDRGSQADAASPPAKVVPAASAFRNDALSLTLKPGEGAEIKAVMRAGDQMAYAWTADKGELFFDFHGEPKGAPADVFTSFEKGSKRPAQGDFEAPFEGIHGWYWKNRTQETVTVQLTTSGVYETIGRK